jgi:hypothetical protein
MCKVQGDWQHDFAVKQNYTFFIISHGKIVVPVPNGAFLRARRATQNKN